MQQNRPGITTTHDSRTCRAIALATVDVAAKGCFPAEQTQFENYFNNSYINHLTPVFENGFVQKQTQFSPPSFSSVQEPAA